MAAAEAAGEAPMFERAIEVIPGIVTAGIMSDPFIIRMDMGSFGMSTLIRKAAAWQRCRLLLPRILFRPWILLWP